MNKKTVEYLRCPEDKGSLDMREGQLYCESCDTTYQVTREGIPILRRPGYLTPNDKEKSKIWIKGLEKETNEKGLGDNPIDALISIYNVKAGLVPVRYGLDRSDEIEDIFYALFDKPDSVVLDFCSGVGFCIQNTLARYPETNIVGFDKDFFPLKFQRKKLEKIGKSDNVDLVCVDAFNLPFADNTFGYLTADAGFNATSDPLMAMKEAYRVMKQGAIGVTSIGKRDGEENSKYEKYLDFLRASGFQIIFNVEWARDDSTSMITKFEK